jgi:hypothetical protein
VRIIIGVVMAALLASPAYSQLKPSINLAPEKPPLTDQEKERQKEIDDAYRAAQKKIPDQKAASDPWGNMRDTGASQANPRANSGSAKSR